MSSHSIKKLIVGSGAILGYRVTGAAITFLTQVLLIRWVGAEQFGVYIWAFSLATLFSSAVGLGLQEAAPRILNTARSANDRAREKGFLYQGAALILIMSIVLMLGAWSVSVMTTGEFPNHLVLAFLIIPFFGLARFTTGISITNRWMALGLIPNQVVRPLLFLLAASIVWFASHRLGPDRLMLLQLITVIIAALIIVPTVFHLSLKKLAGHHPSGSILSWLKVSLPLLAISLVVDYFPELILILFGSVLSNTELSICSAALRLSILITFALKSIDTFLTPDIAMLAASKKLNELEKVVRHAARVRAAAAVAAFFVFLIFGKFLLSIFGPEFPQGFTFLMFLVVGQVIISSFGPCAHILSLSGYQNLSLAASFASISVLVIGVFTLLPALGLTGAGIITLLANIVWITIQYYGLRKRMHIRSDIF